MDLLSERRSIKMLCAFCAFLWLNFLWLFAASICFVRYEVAGEDLDNTFGGADKRRHIQADMNGAGDQALFLNLIARQPKSKNGPDNGNGFDEALRYAPATSSNDSSFDRAHR